MATGDWSTFDLVKYLVSVQSTLTASEKIQMRRLGETRVFSKETAGNGQSAAGSSPEVERYRAKDLYEPVDFFRELGLPIIDWGANNQWHPKSDEGKSFSGLQSNTSLTSEQPNSSSHWA
jgi:Protein of unknown function (DUF3684)